MYINIIMIYSVNLIVMDMHIQYIAFEYGINRNDQDIGGKFSPLTGINDAHEYYN